MPIKDIHLSSIIFADSVYAFQKDFQDTIARHGSYPILRFFQRLPLQPEYSETQEAIISRGSLAVEEGELKNEGETISATFIDDAVGNIQITLDVISARLHIEADSLDFDFSASPVHCRVFSRQYAAKRIYLNHNYVIYELSDIVSPADGIRIYSHLTEDSLLKHRPLLDAQIRANDQPLFKFLLTQLSEDEGCGEGSIMHGDTWAVWRGNTNFICDISHDTNQPDPGKPVKVSGGYATYSDAEAALQRHKEDGECM